MSLTNPKGLSGGRTVCTHLVFLIALSFCAPALSQTGDSEKGDSASEGEVSAAPFKRHIVFYKTALAHSQNPLGLASVSEIGYRLNLFDSDNILLGDTHAALSFAPYLTPAFSRLGLKLKVKPIALLELAARYDVINYFGNFGLLQSFSSPLESYDDDRLEEREAQGLNKAASGDMVTLEALLQAKVGSFAARSAFKAYLTNLDLPEDETVHYMASLDVLVPTKGMTFSIDTDALYLSDGGLTAGLRHTLVQPIYKDTDFGPLESSEKNPNGPIHRLGTLIAYKFNKDKGTHFDEPTAFLLVQWYLKHRNRAGQNSSQFLPYMALGFSFSGHIL